MTDVHLSDAWYREAGAQGPTALVTDFEMLMWCVTVRENSTVSPASSYALSSVVKSMPSLLWTGGMLGPLPVGHTYSLLSSAECSRGQGAREKSQSSSA